MAHHKMTRPAARKNIAGNMRTERQKQTSLVARSQELAHKLNVDSGMPCALRPIGERSPNLSLSTGERDLFDGVHMH